MPFSSSLAVSEPPNSVNSKRLNIHFPISLWQILKHLQKTTFFMSLKTWLVFNIVRIKCRKLIYYMLSLVVYPWMKIQFYLDYELLEGRPYLAVYFNGRDMFHSVMAFWTLPRLTLSEEQISNEAVLASALKGFTESGPSLSWKVVLFDLDGSS